MRSYINHVRKPFEMSTYKIIRLKVTQNEHLQKNIVGPTAAFSFLAVPFRRLLWQPPKARHDEGVKAASHAESALAKMLDLKPFRISTYKNGGGRGWRAGQ
jgi:hypothetical protein